MGLDQVRGQRAGAHHQHLFGVLGGQIVRRQGGGRRGPAQGEHGTVDQRQGLSGLAVHQHIDTHHRGQAAVGVSGGDGDHFHADMVFAVPGRHEQQRGVRFGRPRQGVVMTQGHLDVGFEGLAQPFHQAGEVQGLLHIGGTDHSHGVSGFR